MAEQAAPRDATSTASTSAPVPESSHLRACDRKGSSGVLKRGVNLRDVGLLSPTLITGKLYRSSQAVTANDLAEIKLRAVIDLRQKASICGRMEHEFLRELTARAGSIAAIPRNMLPEFIKPEFLRTQPVVCAPCSQDSDAVYGNELSVYHVDLVNRGVSWAIFYAMPRFVKYKVLTAALTCTHPEQIMAPAVADDNLYGYLRLYQTLLDSSKPEWARALRVLAHGDHLPALVHCIHGKDRTGVLIMLVALLCGVEEELVVQDYIASERMLKEGRDDGTLGLPDHLCQDEVIAAKRSVMEQTIQYLHQNYGGAEGYAHAIGLTHVEVAQLRVALMVSPPHLDLVLLGLEQDHTAAHDGGQCLQRTSSTFGSALHSLRSLTLDPRKVFRISLGGHHSEGGSSAGGPFAEGGAGGCDNAPSSPFETARPGGEEQVQGQVASGRGYSRHDSLAGKSSEEVARRRLVNQDSSSSLS